jgi:hypothetical protein
MSHCHAVVRLDRHGAKVFHVTETQADKVGINGRAPGLHINTCGGKSRAHARADDGFLHAVVEALSGAQEWLIAGPGEAKRERVRPIERHDPQYRSRIGGVESADHPPDGQVCALARRVVAKVDRRLPQR